MYLHHRHGCSSISLKISSSNPIINNILYGGANFAPIAVSCFSVKFFSLKVKILFLRTISASYNSFEVVTSFSCLKYSRLRRANRPSSSGMLRYKSTTPTVYKTISSGKFGKERSFFKKSFFKEKTIFLGQIELKPCLWWRYIEDIFFLWENGEEKLKEFIEHLNVKYPIIKFTAKWSQTSINFLDVPFSLKDGKVTTDLYLKLTDSHQYFHSSSCHSYHCKKGISYSQGLCLNRICSDPKSFDGRCNYLEKWLIERGCSEREVRK